MLAYQAPEKQRIGRERTDSLWKSSNLGGDGGGIRSPSTPGKVIPGVGCGPGGPIPLAIFTECFGVQLSY